MRRRRPVRRTAALACVLLVCPWAVASAAAEEGGGGADATRVDSTEAAAPEPSPAAYGEESADGTGDARSPDETSGTGKTRSATDETDATGETGGCRNAGTSAGTLALSVLGTSFLCLINAERDTRAAPAVAADTLLQRSADDHSHDMVVNGFFGHSSFSGSSLLTRVRRAGYLEDARRWLLGETLA